MTSSRRAPRNGLANTTRKRVPRRLEAQRHERYEGCALIKQIRSLLLIAALGAAFAGCSKSADSDSGTASSKATAMVYSGSTDTSTAGGAATPAAAGGTIAAGDAVHGKAIFTQNCSACHGATGAEGGVGPSLKGEKARKDLAKTVEWIKNPSPPMPKLYPSPLGEKDVVDVATYVQSI